MTKRLCFYRVPNETSGAIKEKKKTVRRTPAEKVTQESIKALVNKTTPMPRKHPQYTA